MRKNVLIIFAAVILAVLVFTVPFRFILNFSHDDSFFYLKTALNFSGGFGSTFDGINSTNGYHPLYFLAVSGLFFTAGIFSDFSPETLFRFVFLSHIALLIISSVYVYRFSVIYFSAEYIKLKLAVLFGGLFALVFIKDFGVETHLTLLILSIYLCMSAGEQPQGEKVIKKALLLSLLFLSRTDYLYSLIPLMLVYESAAFRSCGPKRILSLSLPVILTASVYYVLNYVIWGNAFTVSAVICSSFPDFLFAGNLAGITGDKAKFFNQFIRLALLAVTPAVFFVFRKTEARRIKISRIDFLLLMLIAGFLLFSFLHLSYNHRSLREWYMTVTVLPCIYLLIKITEPRKSLILKSALVLVITSSILTFAYIRLMNFKFDAAYNYAKEIGRTVPKDQKIFQMDFTGIIGYFSERSVVNGDGLINSFEYLKELRSGSVLDFMKNDKIRYYSTFTLKKEPFENDVFTENSFGKIFNGGYLKLDKRNIIIESPYFYDHAMFTTYGKWLLFKTGNTAE